MMNPKSKSRAFTLAAGVLFGALSMGQEAHSAPITWNFSGVVTSVVNPENMGNVQSGNSVSGSITYETTTPESDSQFGGLYKLYTGAILGWSVNVGGYSATLNAPANNWMNMQNDLQGADGTNLVTFSPTTFDNGTSSFLSALFSIELADSTQQVFDAVTLPTFVPSISQFNILNRGRIANNHVDLNSNIITFELTSLYATGVPAPGALVLFGLGLVCVASLRRKLPNKQNSL